MRFVGLHEEVVLLRFECMNTELDGRVDTINRARIYVEISEEWYEGLVAV